MIYKTKAKSAFTLAEVLITLVIIGIVAALTIPTAISKYQKQQTVVKLKKAFSAIYQTTYRAVADYGPVESWDITDFTSADAAKQFLNKYVTPYMSVSKEATTRAEGNWIYEYDWLNGHHDSYGSSYARFYLADGTSVTSKWVSSATVKRVQFFIDINGDKKPNKLGRDIFLYYYYILGSYVNEKFVPEGFGTERNSLVNGGTYSCSSESMGSHCAALIMKDSWQIKDDYPW